MSEQNYRMIPYGEAGIMIQFGNQISPDIHQQVAALSSYLDQHPFPGMKEYIPAFTSVTIFFDPWVVRQTMPAGVGSLISASYDRMVYHFEQVLKNLGKGHDFEPEKVIIPVCYGGDFGPDLEYVAEYNGLTPEEVVRIHSEGEYLVYMIGFSPGFPYLGGMSQKIATPRRSTPRLKIPAGSVGIAGDQTGAYSIESPGGWQLIGQTPLDLFRPEAEPPILLKSGNIIQFQPITLEEYEQQKGVKK